jgi:hypothetical protein
MATVGIREAAGPSIRAHETSNSTAHRTALSLVGFWAALLTTLWTVWFIAAFGPWIASQPSWKGIDAFAASFQALPYLAWVLPCLLLALTFPVMLAAIYLVATPERRIWGWLGAMFAAFYGAVLAAVYWVILTVVPSSIDSGDVSGLTPLIVTSPHSIANSLEGIGYGFMGLATLFGGLAFGGGRLGSWIRWLLIVNGLAGVAGVALGGFGIVAATMLALVAWAVTLPIATVLLAVFFYRWRDTSMAQRQD